MPPALDREIAILAARQHGVVSRRQLLAMGVGRGAIQRRIEAGRLCPIHRGVFAVGHARLAGRARWMAAVLACGPGALLSHRSAALLFGIASAGERIDVTVQGEGRTAPEGIRLHRVRHLPDDVRAATDAIPHTTLARTLLDLAETITDRQLRRVWEQAERLRILDVEGVSDLLARSPGRHGLAPLRALVAERHAPEETRSELERRFLDLCREAGLARPATNVVVCGFEVDAYWPAHRLVIELDGFAYHRSREAFEADRERDTALQLAGIRVVRLTHRGVFDDGQRVKGTVRTLLAATGSRAGGSAFPRA